MIVSGHSSADGQHVIHSRSNEIRDFHIVSHRNETNSIESNELNDHPHVAYGSWSSGAK